MVSGNVVRIDQDEVLVDIGYKSEGVIPINELSIRKSVDPHDEVQLGEEVDALVLTKEDQDGRLRAVQEARPLREGLAPHRGRRRVRRAGRGHGHRGRQGRPDHRPRGARLPAGLARGHPPRAEPRRVPRPEDRVQGHRAQPLAQQRGALAPRGARGGAQGGPPADPRPAPAGSGRGGRDLEHRGLRRLRGPRRDRRPDPHLRALLEPREPSVRDPLDRRRRAGQGARHRPRAPAHLARPQADAGRSLAAGHRDLPGGRRARGQGHQGRHLRRVRRDHGRGRGPRAHLRARPAPRGEPARDRRAGPGRAREDPRDRLRAPPPLAERQARGGPARAHQDGRGRRRGRQRRRRARATCPTSACPRTSSPART